MRTSERECEFVNISSACIYNTYTCIQSCINFLFLTSFIFQSDSTGYNPGPARVDSGIPINLKNYAQK